MHQLLGAVDDEGRPAFAHERAECVAHLRVAQHVAVDVVGAAVLVADCDAQQRAAPGVGFPPALEHVRVIDGAEVAQPRGGRRRVGHDRNVGVERLGLGLGGLLADRLEQSGQERSELELIEQDTHLLAIP